MKKIYYNQHIIYVVEYDKPYPTKIYIVEIDDSQHDTLEQAKRWIDYLSR